MHNEYLNNPVKYLPTIRTTSFNVTNDILLIRGLDSVKLNTSMQYRAAVLRVTLSLQMQNDRYLRNNLITIITSRDSNHTLPLCS